MRRSYLDPVVCGGDQYDLADDSQDPAVIINGEQELALLLHIAEALPPRCRQVFTLRKVYGLSHKEIANRLGITPHTVEAQLGKAMRRCAKALGR
jgi:RNA polymerase sigma factor (sigma-70 family)